MQTGTIMLYDRDGAGKEFSLDAHARMVGNGEVGTGKKWSSVAPPPAGWDRETPRYRIRRDLRPTAFARHRLEAPFEQGIDVWQYADRVYKAGEEIATTNWPHSSMIPLTYGAEKVLQFFTSRMISRLATAPWHIDRLRLDDGLSGPLIPAVDVPRPPRDQPAAPTSARPVQHSMRRG